MLMHTLAAEALRASWANDHVEECGGMKNVVGEQHGPSDEKLDARGGGLAGLAMLHAAAMAAEGEQHVPSPRCVM